MPENAGLANGRRWSGVETSWVCSSQHSYFQPQVFVGTLGISGACKRLSPEGRGSRMRKSRFEETDSRSQPQGGANLLLFSSGLFIHL